MVAAFWLITTLVIQSIALLIIIWKLRRRTSAVDKAFETVIAKKKIN